MVLECLIHVYLLTYLSMHLVLHGLVIGCGMLLVQYWSGTIVLSDSRIQVISLAFSPGKLQHLH